ncbi:hypothetical protein Esti_005260 [Eimeria stiedai]
MIWMHKNSCKLGYPSKGVFLLFSSFENLRVRARLRCQLAQWTQQHREGGKVTFLSLLPSLQRAPSLNREEEEARRDPPSLLPEAEAGKEPTCTPRTSNGGSLAAETALVVVAKGNNSSRGQAPPARNDSAATSCAGYTDVDFLSRRSTFQAEVEHCPRASHATAAAAAAPGKDEVHSQEPLLAIQDGEMQQHRSEESKYPAAVEKGQSTTALATPQQQRKPSSYDREAAKEAAGNDQEGREGLGVRGERKRMNQEVEEERRGLAKNEDEGQGRERQKNSEDQKRERQQGEEKRVMVKIAQEEEAESQSQADDLVARVQETFSTVKQSLSRGYESLRSVSFGEGFRRAPTEVVPELQQPEQCICGVLNEITELGERAMPCLLGEHADEETEVVPVHPSPSITMIVNTPAGPYVRRIPDALVGDAVGMGFISEEEVMKQRDQWEQTFGPISIEYTPAISFAEQQATAYAKGL